MATRALHSPKWSKGFTLVEMMVAMAVGLVLIAVMSVVYLNSKNSTKRQDQLSFLQQNVRAAFEYMSFDARMVGHLGCFTRHPSGIAGIATPTLAENFAVAVEGYEYAGTSPSNTFTLTSSAPADDTNAAAWSNATGPISTPLLSAISGAAGGGLTPGSDVLILRGAVSGKPTRLTAAVTNAATTIPIENTSTGTCPDGTANTSGFCAGSYGVIASCTAAQAFRVTTAGPSLAIQSGIQGSVSYDATTAEVFPAQTTIYYVKRSSSGTTTSLYRRVLDGAQTDPTLQEQELIEGVESLQVRYGMDLLPLDPDPRDGLIDGGYVAASAVTDWSRVIAVRMSLLMRSTVPLDGDLTPATSKPINGMTIAFPTAGQRFDRRVFTTTVALRNRIAYPSP
jgi:type IV pilus assembly protein PilW